MLPPEALARCVARAFLTACSCLHGLIQLSAAAKTHASKLRTRDIVTSEAPHAVDRHSLQSPSLGELNEQQEVNKLLRSADGLAILPLAVRAECKLLLAQPTVQHFLTAEWLDHSSTNSSTAQLVIVSICCGWPFCCCYYCHSSSCCRSPCGLPELCLANIRRETLCLHNLYGRLLGFSTDRPYLLDVPIVPRSRRCLTYFLRLSHIPHHPQS